MDFGSGYSDPQFVPREKPDPTKASGSGSATLLRGFFELCYIFSNSVEDVAFRNFNISHQTMVLILNGNLEVGAQVR